MDREKQIIRDEKDQENSVLENEMKSPDQEWVYDIYQPVPVLNYAYH